MNHLTKELATALACASLLGAALLAVPMMGAAETSTSSTSTASPIQFGMDAGSVSAQKAAGVAPDYGTFWVGPWTLSSGWGGPDTQLAAMKAAGVTPAIHFYYWGDDISPSCVENGCWSSLHNAQKTRAGWNTLATQLGSHLNSKMGGEPVVVFLESEFNKGGISTYEPFDGYMAAMAAKIHADYPNAIVVLGFGNWDSGNWDNFDRVAAESDMVGIQGMRGSTRQSKAEMMTLYDGLLAGVKVLEASFPGKPIMLTDIAVSSYPEPDYLQVQADVLAEVFTNIGVLKGHGVEAMIYRSWKDSPNMDLANYYGQAERHWGLVKSSDGTQKAAAKVWIDGVKAERADSAPQPPPAPANRAPVAAFTATASGLKVTADASSASDPDGQALTYAWTFGDGSTATTKAASHTYAAGGTYTVTLKVSDGSLSSTATKSVTVAKPATYSATFTTNPASNEWWVQEKVTSSPAPAKVDVRVNGGSWIALKKESYGDWTLSKHIAKGSQVAFRATAPDGQMAYSPTQSWLGASSTTTTTPFKATFSPKAVGNNWWVETAVSANAPIAKVEAKVGSGSYTVLAKQDWGHYAKSVHAPNGSKVTFRATSSSGATSTSSVVTWY